MISQDNKNNNSLTYIYCLLNGRPYIVPWKKSYDQPRQHIKKPTKVRLVKALVFPVVTYGCENWIIKKAEH